MVSRLSVSNICFPPEELGQALTLLVELDVDAIEVAPYNLFGRWDLSDADLDVLSKRLGDAGIHCLALQGIVRDTFPIGTRAEKLISSPEMEENHGLGPSTACYCCLPFFSLVRVYLDLVWPGHQLGLGKLSPL
jgi:hypothetical protein